MSSSNKRVQCIISEENHLTVYVHFSHVLNLAKVKACGRDYKQKLQIISIFLQTDSDILNRTY